MSLQLAQQQQRQQQQHSGVGHGPTGLGAEGGPRIDFAALRDNPQIQQLREHISNNPALVQPLIQQLAAQNPAIADMVRQNPEALAEMLGIQHGEGDDDIPPGAHVVSVTEEERAAIGRVSFSNSCEVILVLKLVLLA